MKRSKTLLVTFTTASSVVLPFAVLPMVVSCSNSEYGPANTWYQSNVSPLWIKPDGEVKQVGSTLNPELVIPNELTIIKSAWEGEVISVKKIADAGFDSRGITSLTATGDSLRIIGKEAFKDTKKLVTVKLGSKLELIEQRAFAGSGLKEVILPENCKYYSDSFPSGTNVIGGKKID